jgi:hypothetical protein
VSDVVDKVFLKREKLKDAIALSAIKCVFESLPFGSDVVIRDGVKGKIEEFYKPKRDEEGRVRAGVDIRIKDFPLDHIELTIEVTGWGGAVPHEVVPDVS